MFCSDRSIDYMVSIYIVTHTSIDWVLITLIVLIITKKLKKCMCHIHISSPVSFNPLIVAI